MSKADELFGLYKIPDRELLSNLLLERGKNLAYIEELEDALGKHGGCSRCRAKDELIKSLEKKNKKLQSKEDKKEESFEKLYYDLLKKYERLEKQLFEIAKSRLT